MDVCLHVKLCIKPIAVAPVKSVADSDIRLEGPHHVADPQTFGWGGGFNVSQYFTFISSFEGLQNLYQKLEGGHGRISPVWIRHCVEVGPRLQHEIADCDNLNDASHLGQNTLT